MFHGAVPLGGVLPLHDVRTVIWAYVEIGSGRKTATTAAASPRSGTSPFWTSRSNSPLRLCPSNGVTAIDALKNAAATALIETDAIWHSDRGSAVYTAAEFHALMTCLGMLARSPIW